MNWPESNQTQALNLTNQPTEYGQFFLMNCKRKKKKTPSQKPLSSPDERVTSCTSSIINSAILKNYFKHCLSQIKMGLLFYEITA